MSPLPTFTCDRCQRELGHDELAFGRDPEKLEHVLNHTRQLCRHCFAVLVFDARKKETA